jgi:hypothetical protein
MVLIGDDEHLLGFGNLHNMKRLMWWSLRALDKHLDPVDNSLESLKALETAAVRPKPTRRGRNQPGVIEPYARKEWGCDSRGRAGCCSRQHREQARCK